MKGNKLSTPSFPDPRQALTSRSMLDLELPDATERRESVLKREFGTGRQGPLSLHAETNALLDWQRLSAHQRSANDSNQRIEWIENQLVVTQCIFLETPPVRI